MSGVYTPRGVLVLYKERRFTIVYLLVQLIYCCKSSSLPSHPPPLVYATDIYVYSLIMFSHVHASHILCILFYTLHVETCMHANAVMYALTSYINIHAMFYSTCRYHALHTNFIYPFYSLPICVYSACGDLLYTQRDFLCSTCGGLCLYILYYVIEVELLYSTCRA